MIWVRFSNWDCDKVAGPRSLGTSGHAKVDKSVIGGSTGQSTGVLSSLLGVVGDEQLLVCETQFCCFLRSDSILQCHQPFEPLLDYFFRNLVIHLSCGSPLSRRVLEGIGHREA